MSPPVAPVHDTPILGMIARPKVDAVTEYGNAASFWVEYPSGLVDLTRTTHVAKKDDKELVATADATPPPLKPATQFELEVEGGRVLRLNKAQTAIVIIDMQKYADFVFMYTMHSLCNTILFHIAFSCTQT